MLVHLEPMQWGFGVLAAFLVGVSKTGLPGAGMLVVTLLATVFGGRLSVGIMLPMLIFADCFAVAWYRRHAQWDKLVGLLPWVIAGMAVGAVALWATGKASGHKDVLGVCIGVLVLIMLALYLLQDRLDKRMTPRSKLGVASTGVAAGFTTMVSNAAGSIMSIYMAAHKLPKKQFIGTLAWYFFILNLSKLPVYIVLSAVNPRRPVITMFCLRLDILMLPVIVAGVFVGKWLLPRISQKQFESVVLFLAGAAATKLIYDWPSALVGVAMRLFA